MRLALYGGSFDPPHLGHILSATHVLCSPKVDRLHVIPTHTHPFGKALTPFEARCEMLEAALGHLGSRLVIDPIESELEGVSYTIDMLSLFKEKHPDAELLWVGGADTWNARHTWHRWSDIEAMVTPYILGREGETPPEDISVEITIPKVSSSDIREAIKSGRPVDHLIPPPVSTLIAKYDLYR